MARKKKKHSLAYLMEGDVRMFVLYALALGALGIAVGVGIAVFSYSMGVRTPTTGQPGAPANSLTPTAAPASQPNTQNVEMPVFGQPN